MTSPMRADLDDRPGRSADRATVRAVERGVADLRRGDPVVIWDGRACLVQAAEAVAAKSLTLLKQLVGAPPALAITARRAAVLGFGTFAAPVAVIGSASGLTEEVLQALVDPSRVLARAPGLGPPIAEGLTATAAPPRSPEAAAVALAKLARLLPAAVVTPLQPAGGGRIAAETWAASHDLLALDVAAIADHQRHAASSLAPVADAAVPLLDAQQTRIVAFRPADGGAEHLAILIGDPLPGETVLVRLHSECFTGDLLGSLRCDCGDQLRGAIREIARQGSGVVLYLAQEGRGIGLVNKLRAYRLQDDGFDTIDANEALGFDADERVYLPAAEMLRQLGFPRVRLLTNNPEKLRQLGQAGIEVAERVPHVIPGNGHNDGYLRTKAARSGHLL